MLGPPNLEDCRDKAKFSRCRAATVFPSVQVRTAARVTTEALIEAVLSVFALSGFVYAAPSAMLVKQQSRGCSTLRERLKGEDDLNAMKTYLLPLGRLTGLVAVCNYNNGIPNYKTTTSCGGIEDDHERL